MIWIPVALLGWCVAPFPLAVLVGRFLGGPANSVALTPLDGALRN